MGMERLESICARLVAHGRDAATPAAVVHRATLSGQRIVRAPLAELADAARTAGVGAPPNVISYSLGANETACAWPGCKIYPTLIIAIWLAIEIFDRNT